VNKSQLRDAIAERTDLSTAQAEAALDAALAVVTETVASGDKVALPGFGTFVARERSARTGRNPQTGAEMEIPATTAPAFKAGAGFKKAVAGD
jgi:DNA-binding protein HU-beta